MIKLSDKNVNKMYNEWIQMMVLYKDGISKNDLVSILNIKTGVEEKELKKIKKADLIETYVEKMVFTQDDGKYLPNASIPVFEIAKSLCIEDRKKLNFLINKAGIEPSWLPSYRNGGLYDVLNFKQINVLLNYIKQNYEAIEKQDVIYVFLSSKNKDTIKDALEDFGFQNGEIDNDIGFDKKYDSYYFKANLLLERNDENE